MKTIFLVLFMLAQGVDAWTTIVDLKRYGVADEANPIARWLLARLGIVVPVIILKAAFVALGVFLWRTGGLIPDLALFALTLVGIDVAANNVKVVTEVD